MDNLTLTPVALLADSLKETHGITFENVSTSVRPDFWSGRWHGFKLELEQQKRGQLRVVHRIQRVLVLQLRDQQLHEPLAGDLVLLTHRGRRRGIVDSAGRRGKDGGHGRAGPAGVWWGRLTGPSAASSAAGSWRCSSPRRCSGTSARRRSCSPSPRQR